jgi:hypothetical protein
MYFWDSLVGVGVRGFSESDIRKAAVLWSGGAWALRMMEGNLGQVPLPQSGISAGADSGTIQKGRGWGKRIGGEYLP